VQLQRLELRRCRIDGLGASILARGIEAPGCPISMLCVDGNSFDGDEGAMPFGACIFFPFLPSEYTAHCNLTRTIMLCSHSCYSFFIFLLRFFFSTIGFALGQNRSLTALSATRVDLSKEAKKVWGGCMIDNKGCKLGSVTVDAFTIWPRPLASPFGPGPAGGSAADSTPFVRKKIAAAATAAAAAATTTIAKIASPKESNSMAAFKALTKTGGSGGGAAEGLSVKFLGLGAKAADKPASPKSALAKLAPASAPTPAPTPEPAERGGHCYCMAPHVRAQDAPLLAAALSRNRYVTSVDLKGAVLGPDSTQV